jgi:hypothetical protein
MSPPELPPLPVVVFLALRMPLALMVAALVVGAATSVRVSGRQRTAPRGEKMKRLVLGEHVIDGDARQDRVMVRRSPRSMGEAQLVSRSTQCGGLGCR